MKSRNKNNKNCTCDENLEINKKNVHLKKINKSRNKIYRILKYKILMFLKNICFHKIYSLWLQTSGAPILDLKKINWST